MKEFMITIAYKNSNITDEFNKIKFTNITPIKNNFTIYETTQEIKYKSLESIMFNEEFADLYKKNIISYDIKFKKKFIGDIKFGREIGKHRNSSKDYFFLKIFGNKIAKKQIYKVYNLEKDSGTLIIYKDMSVLLIQNESKLCYENVYKGNLARR